MASAGNKGALSQKSQEIAEEYISSLSDLTINSKPLINMLTILAEENIEHAPAIVQAVEAHLQKVRSEVKLPVLYLIDSIVKNVDGAYLSLFTQNIVNTFCNIFQKVDENVRISMWKLRQTWNEVFPPTKLFNLDVQVQSIDPAWPVTSVPSVSSKSIHVNPRFLSSMPQKTVQPAVQLPLEEAAMREQILKKQQQLLELEKKKLELEMLQTKACLDQQQKQLDRQGLLKANVLKKTATLEKMVKEKTAISTVTHQAPKALANKYPSAAVGLLKESKPGFQVMPTNSTTLTLATPTLSRDPRLKTGQLPVEAHPQVSSPVAVTTQEGSKQRKPTIPESQPMHQGQQPSRVIPQPKSPAKDLVSEYALLNSSPNARFPTEIPIESQSQIPNIVKVENEVHVENSKNSNNKNLDNKRAKDSQKKDHPPRSSNYSSHHKSAAPTASNQSKSSSTSPVGSSSSSSKSSSTGSSSKTSPSSTSSSSSRKLGSKSRSKSSTSSCSPTKIAKLASPPQKSKSVIHLSPSPDSSAKSIVQQQPRKKVKSRKHSPTSSSYRIPHRSVEAKSSSAQGLDEEEQSGSLIVSPPHPPTFKEIRQNTKQRNYVRRNKDSINVSPDSSSGDVEIEVVPVEATKDEDLRPPLVVAATAIATTGVEKKEDLDLRILQPPNSLKRQSAEHNECKIAPKKSKAEQIDELFGNEDVDLRTLTNPRAGRPPTPPPPVISGDEGKDSWAKLKSPTKTDRDVRSSEKQQQPDRGRDRFGRPRLASKTPEDPKDRRRGQFRDDRNERNNERNIEIIMKQAADQLNQGLITKFQYNNWIQHILHMSEDQKLRQAQRKEKESMMVWEKGINIEVADRQSNLNPNEENLRPKDHVMHRQNGPRWNPSWPWAHPPGPFQGHFTGDIRQGVPWANHPRHFNQMRPEFNVPFHGGFNPRMAPGIGPGMGPGMGPALGPMGPNGLPMLNGPMNPLGHLPHMPGMMMNGPMRSGDVKCMSPNSGLVPNMPPGGILGTSSTKDIKFDNEDCGTQGIFELPPPDPNLIDEILNDSMKSIKIDNRRRDIRYYGKNGVVFMHWDDPRDIGFQDGTRRIMIDGKDTIVCAFNNDYQEFMYEGEVHRIRLGAPTRELYVDDKWYECYFGIPVVIDLCGKKISVTIEGPAPQVKIGTVKRIDLVVAKITLIIDAKNIVPIFLDAKPQMFEINGEKHTLEFIDALQTVLLNGRPFKCEFGCLPKPIFIRNEKHFIRFSVLPKGVTAGKVKIMGMRGEAGASPPVSPRLNVTSEAQTLALPVNVEKDRGTTHGDNASVAPATGLSYQAEPAGNVPAPTPTTLLPLTINELYQRLVETGIVPDTTEQPKQEEEEKKMKKEDILVSLNKPETLKTKPTIWAALYTGMQCSSCGVRFAPELATRYSHHLDWHFRQNRKERDSTRKAHSRPWFYDISDWIQFEEIEDIEDRAQSWFETEKQAQEMESAAAGDRSPEALQPSVPSRSNDDNTCQVCHDTFEQFYNEEMEEWHLRPAVCFEGNNYHPFCLEDHKRALEKSAMLLEESLAELEDEKESENEQKATVDTVVEDKLEESEVKEGETEKEKDEDAKEVETKENSEGSEKNAEVDRIGDKNDEVVENTEKETEIDIGTEHEKANESEKMNVPDNTDESANVEESKENVSTMNSDSASISVEEVDDEGDAEIIEKTFETIKIKEEPMDVPDDNEELIFPDVKIKEEPMDTDTELEECVVTKPTVVDTTQVDVKSTIDGNVEHESRPATIPVMPSKIKINIMKPLNVPKETTEEPKEKSEEVDRKKNEPAAPLVAASLKPSLQGRKLSKLPRVEKGTELSAFCSIM